ncbi:unnamed protein product [Nesidiocoris tenuis]|uniref:Nitrogen permease regulator 2-like protein n=1 Tax=Nesidiocoris tenuis TaxID=355587 RepID=A0A6H5HEI6_9HEMI|nr:unnamed protein product [Nesidiocoris tenuis]
MDKNAFFEGCGKEGPIRCIFFCEFHPTTGPKISVQVPADFISKDTFEAVSVYLITKAQLLRSTLTVTFSGIKILGYPVRIENKKYPRNAYHFNICFVCDAWARTAQYETVVKKLSEFLILPYIDSMNHVAKIAALADVENNLVRTCLQNLVYYGVISMVPIFQYSNCYAVTSKLKKLAHDKKLQDDCLRAVSRSSWQLPNFRDIFRLYCSMNHGTTVKDLCLRFNLQAMKVDERKLVQFGLVEKIIRRIHKYPTIVMEGLTGEAVSLYPYFTGGFNVDEICCRLSMSTLHLETLVEKDHNVTVVYR